MFLIIKALRNHLIGFLLFAVIAGSFFGFYQYKLYKAEQERQQTKLRRKQQNILVFTKPKFAYEDKVPIDLENRKVVAVIETGEEVKIIGTTGSFPPWAFRVQLQDGRTVLLSDIEDLDTGE